MYGWHQSSVLILNHFILTFLTFEPFCEPPYPPYPNQASQVKCCSCLSPTPQGDRSKWHDREKSPHHFLSTGVPQGLVLGALILYNTHKLPLVQLSAHMVLLTIAVAIIPSSICPSLIMLQ